MIKFKLILIFFLFIVSTTYASVARPFDFRKWNFKKDIDLAYVLMHDLDNGILIKSQDKAGSIKSQEVLTKLNALNAYCNNLQRIIKAKLVRGRFQKEVELPLLKIIRKYKYLTRNYKNKSLIENPEYTKLIAERIIKKALFLENYFQSNRLKNVKSGENIKKRISDNQSKLKSLRSKPNKSVGSKFSKNSRPSKSPQGVKKCNKRRILDKYDLNGAESEFLDDPSQESDELEREYQDDELESEDPDDGEREYQDDRESRDDTFNEDQSEDEFFDSLEDQFI
ncbi:outer membrane protein (plasmid) [Borreliella burgdorferi]|uniref:Putative outer membrane protein BBA52 n=1 Tax=Borreliella burgdorferi (strain ATCC 35210 / DSM 4680 / CIP 102532 / B31) TaxID=224326 RepID=Y2552_BORBU|nr:outer membrane protein [Borreliella burgdorferi]Q44845.2 RecName: Full=Putative outer membrane protein BBA52 [Borreliella burgdorferi B31]AAC66237.1 outer membrane protein [Borreliella burgdorferi B31]ACO37979.1 outer membrane protein [Borreliella burgdorferi Bol26]ARS30952.1 outer membrane protein [Borreliella burgdorferi]ARS32210.1 outer membrane protein [Borreliella burgdorferi]ARS32694.1 outer membrane protein [Borreliella burgdorferi]